MKRTILAILATLGLLVGTATMASAHNYFDSNYANGMNFNLRWSPSYPVITLSDRTGYDMNEYEAGYSWGSYSGDSVSIAYTQQQTCTWCIRVVTASTGSGYNSVGQYQTGGYATQCTIKIDPYWADHHLNANDRQREMALLIGYCLGFESAGGSTYSIMNQQYPVPGIIGPQGLDYNEMAYHY